MIFNYMLSEAHRGCKLSLEEKWKGWFLAVDMLATGTVPRHEFW
jgi:hypothetical protein